jgi:hypothetical protein
MSVHISGFVEHHAADIRYKLGYALQKESVFTKHVLVAVVLIGGYNHTYIYIIYIYNMYIYIRVCVCVCMRMGIYHNIFVYGICIAIHTHTGR